MFFKALSAAGNHASETVAMPRSIRKYTDRDAASVRVQILRRALG